MSQTIAVGYRRAALPLSRVHIDDAFWTPRQELIRTQTLPQQERMMHLTGHFDALKLTWRPGDPKEPHIFWESDLAKWIEAASYCLTTQADPELGKAVDQAIELLATAQQPDGYLNAYFTAVKPGERFTDLRDTHELYCAGHLIEAGVAHYQATGKRTLLEVVSRYADLIAVTFGPGGACEGGYDGHEEIELALVKLYRATGDQRYLDLSKQMVDARGTQPFYFEKEAERRGTTGYFGKMFPQRDEQPERFREYNQSHLPVREQQEIVGHSVRAMYLMSGVTDIAAEYRDPDLFAAAERLWNDLVRTKLYITGGIGSDPSIEGFGPAYALPNKHGYAETCAAIGLVQWAQRMGNLTGQGSYIDTLERALYNGVLSGASADGTHYFYGNPLSSDGDVHRLEWFGCACCPPNLARLISELGHYVYAQGNREAVVNLFVASTADFDFEGEQVTLRQETSYPGEGTTTLQVSPRSIGASFSLAVRIPAWSRPSATLNGEPVSTDVVDGYLAIDRTWAAGDTLELDLGLAPRRTWATPLVTSDAGKVALERGPIVYCLEGVDHGNAVSRLSLSRKAAVTEERDVRTGEVTLHASGLADTTDADLLYQDTPPDVTPIELTAVPYATWGNRGQSDMTVWIREAVMARD